MFLEAKGEFLRENGRVKVRLEPRFTSEPPLAEPEIYALLTLGTPDVARLAETLPQAALGAALENLVLGQLERELSRALGLDRFQVQVPAIQGGSLEETRFSLGKYLSRSFSWLRGGPPGGADLFRPVPQGRPHLHPLLHLPAGGREACPLRLRSGLRPHRALGLSLALEPTTPPASAWARPTGGSMAPVCAPWPSWPPRRA